MKILIVEDDANSRVFLERALLSQGYTVESAANGVRALEKATLSPPDLIISDIMMPEMDGFELCRKVKTDERLHKIPFVFYTATYIEDKDEKLAMALGASRFLIKPMEPEKLFKTISEVIEEHQTGHLSVPNQLPVKMTELERMQVEVYARKLDKKVRELEKERDAIRRADEELIFRNVILSTQQEASIDGILVVDESNAIISYNQRFVEMWGIPPKLVESKDDEPVLQFVATKPVDPDAFLERVKYLYDHKEEKSHEDIALKDGRTFDRYSAPMVGVDAKYYGRVWYFRDITDRKRVEAEREKLLQDLGERVKELGCINDISRLAEKHLISIEEFVQGAVGVLPPAWRYPEICGARITLNSKEFKTANFRETEWSQSADIIVDRKKFGAVTICYLEEKPAVDEGPFLEEERSLINTVAEFLGHIIQHRLTEAEIRDSEERFRMVFDNANDGILLADMESKKFHSGNRMICQMLGYTEEEIKELAVKDILPEADLPFVNEQFEKQARGEIKLVEDIPIKRKDGSIFYADVNSAPVEMSGKHYLLGVFRDITERKRAEESLRDTEQKYRTVFENTGTATVIIEEDGTISLVNAEFEKLCGYPKEEIEGKKSWIGFVAEEDMARMREYHRLRRFDEKVAPTNYEFRFKDRGGKVKNIFVTVAMIPETKKSVAALLDITKRKQAEDELRSEKTFTENALNSLSDVFFVFDLNGKFLRWNKNMNAVLGYSDAEISSMQLVDFFLKEDVRRVLDSIEIALRSGYAGVEARVLTRGGKNIPYEFSGTLLKNHEGKPAGICGIGRDITERKKTEEKIEYLAYYDALTDLPNRNLFLDRVNQAIARAGHRSRIVAVLITNIDRFKSINDTYGPETGDKVLKEIAVRLLTSVRKGDTIARLSNDEFGIALLDVAHPDDIVMVLEKIIKDISYPLNIAGDELALTFSTGISLYPNDGEDTSELLKSAGLALSIAKKEGGKISYFYTEDMNIKAAERMLLEKQLAKAYENKEFILHYQPYWDITTKKMVGMEALVRWQSRDNGLVPPGKFIPVLEETGMIIEVGEWILKEAMRQVKEWQNKGYPVVPVSVNMSLVQFRQKDLAGMIKKIMKDRGYYPSLLTLEITESAFMQDIEFTKSVLTAMKEIGCSVSIDDFGTGYSSLSYLKRFPVDNLKIDISFIREMVRDPDSASIVMAIINMAHTLNLKTIAEGIETEEQWNFLRLLRCDMGQGFYLSKPLPAEDLEKLFISNV